jgi:hypothetical protein
LGVRPCRRRRFLALIHVNVQGAQRNPMAQVTLANRDSRRSLRLRCVLTVVNAGTLQRVSYRRSYHSDGDFNMRAHENVHGGVHFTQASRWLVVLVAGAAIAGALSPRVATADVALVVVDVVAVAEGYRFSKLKGTKVVNPSNDELGELDDLIVGKDRVLFAIVEVGGFLGLGSHLIAVPYTSLQISNGGKRIVLPGATKESIKALPEFKYR